jgi:hypothetical protein
MKFLTLGVLFPFPSGMTPDPAANFGLEGLHNAANVYSEGLSTIVTAGTNSTLTIAQLLSKNIVLTAGASGGFTLTLPATKAIFGALGPVPTDGTFFFPLYISNQGVGQTMTLTAGDASTTVSSTENTLATTIAGKWMVQVATATTLQVTRVMTGSN